MQDLARTHYDVLGVPRNAKNTDINRAYQKLRREMQRETAAPDPRRMLLVDRAYEVLSDESRRAAYDEELRRPKAVVQRTRASRPAMAAIAVVLSAALAGIAWWQVGATPAPAKVASRQEILDAVNAAVGRVQAVDLDGTARPAGLAFALKEGVLGATCRTIGPTSQLTVTFAQRAVPARVADTDEHPTICRLAAEGLGSWPLSLAMADPKPGDTFYLPTVKANGAVGLLTGSVKRIVPDADGRVIEATLPAAPELAGAPLLDLQGKVVGIAAGDGHHRPIPPAWIAEALGPPPEVVRPEAKPQLGPKLITPEDDPHPGRKLRLPDDL